jgi:hypothetical protein
VVVVERFLSLQQRPPGKRFLPHRRRPDRIQEMMIITTNVIGMNREGTGMDIQEEEDRTAGIRRVNRRVNVTLEATLQLIMIPTPIMIMTDPAADLTMIMIDRGEAEQLIHRRIRMSLE